MAEKTKKTGTTSLQEFNSKYGDPWIWGIFIMLILISIVENYTASSQEVEKVGIYWSIGKHMIFLGVGAAFTWIIARHDYNKPTFLAMSIPLLALVTVVTLVLVFFQPVTNGAQRAIHLPGFTFQPTEFSKLSIVTLLAYFLAKYQKNKGLTNGGIAAACLSMGIYAGLMYRSGLTNCLLVGAIGFSMLIIGGIQFKKFCAISATAAILLGGVFIIKDQGNKNDELIAAAESSNGIEHVDATKSDNAAGDSHKEDKAEARVDRSNMRRGRIDAWLHSNLLYEEMNNSNRQAMLSRMAQAHSNGYGVGIGQSRECSRLPLAFSDYIFSIIVEELGLEGGIFVLILYLSLLGRAFMIVRRCHRALPSLLIIGLALFITLQALFHIAINTGVFPVSGQPLPLISKGGTSILTICLAFGIMLSVSRTVTTSKKAKDNKGKEPELPDELNTENPIEIIPEPTPINIWK
ncbi:MAG: FtsW/RodA/SpoVE family cell cycle protein [Muribaculaceae bacterium]|nr:FtsW/RodA/SpoVE family cell cycle protein [Muribaculaceae bacterium]